MSRRVVGLSFKTFIFFSSTLPSPSPLSLSFFHLSPPPLSLLLLHHSFSSSLFPSTEIPLPNEQARLDILKIHASPITKHGEIGTVPSHKMC